MKLLLLTSALPKHPDDYGGRFIAELADALHDLGAEVRLLAPAGRQHPSLEVRRYPTIGGVLEQGGAPDALERSPLRAGLSGLATAASAAAATRIQRRRGERLVTHWLIPNALIAPRGVHYAHGGDVALLERLPGRRRLARFIDRWAGGIIFVSADLRRRFNACLARPPRAPQRVLPMGVSPHRPCPRFTAELRARAAGRAILATVGRLVPIKGLDVLVEALRGVEGLLWVAAGDGPERAALEARAAGLDVHLCGALSPTRRDALLEAADLFALPSRRVGGRSEGTPVSLLEALHRGVPSIATDTGGVGALAASGLALIPPEDPAALRGALVELLGEPARRARMSRQHRAFAVDYAWPALGPRHLEAILSLSCP